MKKICLVNFMYAIALIGLFTACDDNDYDGPEPEEVTANYSNKLADGDRANLALTYSGSELIGKSVYFKTTDAKTAEMTLINVLPHEAQTKIENIVLTPDGNNGYAFSGNATATATGTAFKYDGTVTDGKLKVNLSEVKMTANVLSSNGENGTWYIVHNALTVTDKTEGRVKYNTSSSPTYTNATGSSINMIFSGYVNNLLNNIFSTVLNDVTFQEDGNIVAHYAGLPDGVTFNDLQPTNNTQTGNLYITNRTDYKLSGINLANYYMENDSVLYVIPNVDMIIQQIQKDKQTSRSTSTNIQDLYNQLIRWTTTGIQFKLIENPNKEYTGSGRVQRRAKGDYVLHIDNSETTKCLTSILELLPAILQIVSPDLLEKTVGDLAGDQLPPGLGLLENAKISELLDLIKNEISTSTLEIGLYFNKSNTTN